MTGQQLVESVLRIITGGRNYSSANVEDTLTALNLLKDSWSEENLIQHDNSYESFPIIGGTYQYTLGPTGDMPTTRPTTINTAFLRLNGVDYPLEIITDGEYDKIYRKETVSAYPTQMLVNYSYPNVTIKLWPVPSQDFTLFIDSFKPLADFTLDGEIALPPAYIRAFKYNLAVEMYPEYPGLPVSEATVLLAEESKKVMKRSNSRLIPKANFEFGQPPKPYNVYRGQ